MTEEEKEDTPKVQEEAEADEEVVETVTATNVSNGNKSKIAAGLLGIFLGGFGAHNFYLGNNNTAIIQLCLTLIGWIACGIGPVIASVWGLVEGIMILTGNIKTDANGNPLSD